MVEGSGLENHQADSIRARVQISDPAFTCQDQLFIPRQFE